MHMVIKNNLINYEVLKSEKSDKSLLILPGWMRTSQEWLATAKELSDFYNVYILDFPGFGATPKTNEDLDTYQYAELTREFINKLKIENTSILGHSFGGRVAIILASENLNFEKLILLDSAGVKSDDILLNTKIDLLKFVANSLKNIPFLPVNFIKNLIGSDDYLNSNEMKKTIVKVVNQDLTHLLPKINCPTYIVWGDRDNQVSINLTKKIKTHIKGSIVRVVWGAGHSPHLEKPTKFMEIIKEIL